jgi:UrcA family protein
MRIATAGLVALPLLASAAVSNIEISYTEADLESVNGQLQLYKKMQHAAHKLCGSHDRHITGSVRRSAENKQCYERTLEAAMRRLESPAMMTLHWTQ